MKIIILFNHLQIQDGVARAAIGIANTLVRKAGVEVTLCPLFICDSSMLVQIDDRVIVKPVFKRYFRGLSKLVSMIPMWVLYKIIIGNEYDIEVGFCMTLPIQIIAAYPRITKNYRNVLRLAWMHCYDEGLTLYKEYKRMNKVICVSKIDADRLEKEAKGELSVGYSYNLLNDQEIRNKGEETINIDRPDGILFISVGRMSPEKGYIRLLEVTKRLLDERYRFNLWLIGDGPQKKKLEIAAQKMQLDENVHFFGRQDNPYAYMARADVFVCSSFSEGYSTACTEAIILGIPVLTTNVSGGKEIIDEAEAGLLVGMENEDLYSGMKKILNQPEILKTWKRTLAKTKERFSYASRLQKLYNIFGI